MSNVIEKCKQEFLEEYELGFHKEYFSSKENEVLNEIISNGEESKVSRIFEEYPYEFDTLNDRYIFYRKTPLNYSKEDIDQFIQLKMLEYTKSTNSNIKTIKNFVVFWFVLTLLGLIISFINFIALLTH